MPAVAFDTQPALPWNEESDLLVTSVRPNSANEEFTVSGGFAVYPGAVREAKPSNAVFQYRDYVVTLAIAGVPFSPKPRDTLCWDRLDHLNLWQSDTLVVKAATAATMLRFWRLECFQLVADSDLSDSIAVYRPTVTATSDGLRSRTLAIVTGYSAVAGRIQPEGWQGESETDGRMLRRTTYRAYLSTAITLQAGDVLRVSSVDYEVTGQPVIDDYSTFTTATCTRTV